LTFPEEVDFCLVKLRETSQRPSKLVSFSLFQPFPVVFHGEVSMLACDSSVVRIREVAEDVFHLRDSFLQHSLVVFWKEFKCRCEVYRWKIEETKQHE